MRFSFNQLKSDEGDECRFFRSLFSVDGNLVCSIFCSFVKLNACHTTEAFFYLFGITTTCITGEGEKEYNGKKATPHLHLNKFINTKWKAAATIQSLQFE